MVFKYNVWPDKAARTDAKRLATNGATGNGFTLSERKFAESVLRCCPCVFRCRRAVGIGNDDDQSTAITAINNQTENITPVISLTINRSPDTIEKIINDENEHNNRNIHQITESIITQVQNTNNQLYQDQYHNEEQLNEINLANETRLNNNNPEEGNDEIIENSDKRSFSALEQNRTEDKTINITDNNQTNTNSSDIPDYYAYAANENLNKSQEHSEAQNSSGDKLPIITGRTKIFNQCFGPRKSLKADKVTIAEITHIHSRLSKSANATASKQLTSKLAKKTINKSLPMIGHPKVPIYHYNENFKRSESIESLTDESFVEKGSSSAAEQYGNTDNDLTELMVKSNNKEYDANSKRLSISSSKSIAVQALESQSSFETFENAKPPSGSIVLHEEINSRPPSNQSISSNEKITSNNSAKSKQSKDSINIAIVNEGSFTECNNNPIVPNYYDNTEHKTESNPEPEKVVSNSKILIKTDNHEEIQIEISEEEPEKTNIPAEDFFGHQTDHSENELSDDLLLNNDNDLDKVNDANENTTDDETVIEVSGVENQKDSQNNETVLVEDNKTETNNNECSESENNEADGSNTDSEKVKSDSESQQNHDVVDSSSDEIKTEAENRFNVPKKSTKKTPSKQSLTAKKPISTKSKINLQQCITQLENKDWEVTMKGLSNLSQIARQEPELLETCPSGTISRLIGRHIKSLRSQVARTACSVAGDIFNSGIRVADQDLDDIIKALLHRTADTNKFLRADSNVALDRIVEHFPPHRIISIIVLRGATHQNAIVRATTSRLLYSIISRVGPTHFMIISRDARNKFLNASAKLLIDGNLSARNYAKDIFRTIMHCDGFRKALSDSVSESTLRHIDKTLKSL